MVTCLLLKKVFRYGSNEPVVEADLNSSPQNVMSPVRILGTLQVGKIDASAQPPMNTASTILEVQKVYSFPALNPGISPLKNPTNSIITGVCEVWGEVFNFPAPHSPK